MGPREETVVQLSLSPEGILNWSAIDASQIHCSFAPVYLSDDICIASKISICVFVSFHICTCPNLLTLGKFTAGLPSISSDSQGSFWNFWKMRSHLNKNCGVWTYFLLWCPLCHKMRVIFIERSYNFTALDPAWHYHTISLMQPMQYPAIRFPTSCASVNEGVIYPKWCWLIWFILLILVLKFHRPFNMPWRQMT